MTPLQERFVLEYLIDLNATAAWIRAGGDVTKAARAGAVLLKPTSETGKAIGRAMAERAARTGVNADRVVREAAMIAFGDPRVLFRDDGSLRAPTEYTREDAAMLEGVKTRRIVEVVTEADKEGNLSQKMVPVEIQEVKLASKIGALDKLFRHLGLYNDKLEIVGPLADRLKAAMDRTGAPELTTQPAGGNVIDAEFEEVMEGEEDDDLFSGLSDEERDLI